MSTATKKTAPKKKSVTTAKQWKRPAEELELPSGNVCLVRRPGMRAFVEGGHVPDLLTDLVQKAISGDDKNALKEVRSAAADPKKFGQFFEMMDMIVLKSVVQPKVLPAVDDDGNEIPYEVRDEEAIYVDDIDQDDKMFIFNFAVGGTRDLERFREEQAELMGSLQSGSGVEDEAE